jgi:hypothetical protein
VAAVLPRNVTTNRQLALAGGGELEERRDLSGTCGGTPYRCFGRLNERWWRWWCWWWWWWRCGGGGGGGSGGIGGCVGKGKGSGGGVGGGDGNGGAGGKAVLKLKTIFPTLNSQNYIEFRDNIEVMATF